MHVAAAIVATALAAALVLVQPWAGRRRYRRLVAGVEADPDLRLRHYHRGIAGEWAAVGLVAVIGLLAGRHAASIGVRGSDHLAADALMLGEVAVVLAASSALFRFGGPSIRDALRRQARGFESLLPHSRVERLTFAALAVTAGICEEVLFRGFGISYLRWLWPHAPDLAVIWITALCFGVVHLYQGTRGVVLTGLVGAYLAWVVLSRGSLLPAIVIHALLDLRILALPDLRATAAAAAPVPGHRARPFPT